jgi:hypothetical protein
MTNSFLIDTISVQNFSERGANSKLLYLRITLNHIKKNFHREYAKIQTSLANVGGIVKFLTMSGQFIYFIFSYLIFEYTFYKYITKPATKSKNLRILQNAIKVRLDNTMENNFSKLTSYNLNE